MLNYWSYPFEDEILYSVVGRNISYFNIAGPKQQLANFFGTSNISATLDLPSGIDYLSKQIKVTGFTSKEIIFNYTLYPYYYHYLNFENREKIFQSMLFKSGDIHTRCGINAGMYPSLDTPRYCIQCVQEDIIRHKTVYFRRAHQIPALKICVTHNCFLESTIKNPSRINKHSYIVADKNLLNEKGSFIRKNHNEQIYSISEKLVSLLNINRTVGFNGTPYHYNEKFKSLGFLKGLDTLKLPEIYEAFNKFYTIDTLTHFNSAVNLEYDSCWLKTILRKHRKGFEPVRHILIENFIEHLEQKSDNNITIKSDPESHLCLNPICVHYKSDAYTKLEKHYDSKSKRTIYEIKCSCQYVYTKSFNDSKKEMYIRIKEFGQLWQKKLLDLYSKGLSLRKISRRLNTDPKTVKKYLEPNNSKKQEEVLKVKKHLWITLKKKNPKKSVSELKKLQPSLYSYLYRNSKKWLLNQEYFKRKRIISSKVNWSQRDESLKKRCQDVVHDLKDQYPKKRITKTLLLSSIGVESMYRNNQKKLPSLKLFLQENTETCHQHRIRRLVIASKELNTEGIPLTYWTLLRRANIRKEYISNTIHQLALHLAGELIEFKYSNIKTA